MHDPDDVKTPEDPQDEPRPEEAVPVGITRIREEWRAAGLADESKTSAQTPEVEPVVFPEVDGGAGVGDYVLEYEDVVGRLGLTREAVDRLISSGELDSILLQGPEGSPRRLISESSFDRFRKDSAMDPEAIERAARALADKSLAAAVEELRSEIKELRRTQAQILQQMKDILLLEVRNLKEQDRDLASFVYELAEEIRRVLPKKKSK